MANALSDVTLVGAAGAVQVAAAANRNGVLVTCTVAITRLGGDGTSGAKPTATKGCLIPIGGLPVFYPGTGPVFAFSAGNAVVSITEV